jgi:hypothetical protein
MDFCDYCEILPGWRAHVCGIDNFFERIKCFSMGYDNQKRFFLKEALYTWNP